MSHEEIWDDSALVESWDEAVAEYKRYHSIHARGERIEDVLREHEEATNDKESKATTASGDQETSLEDDVMMDEQTEAALSESTSKDQVESRVESSNAEAIGQEQPAAVTPSMAPPLPPHLGGSVQDEGLKNLLMSWYYAGYYTGLYEGQQKGQQMAKPPKAE